MNINGIQNTNSHIQDQKPHDLDIADIKFNNPPSDPIKSIALPSGNKLDIFEMEGSNGKYFYCRELGTNGSLVKATVLYPNGLKDEQIPVVKEIYNISNEWVKIVQYKISPLVNVGSEPVAQKGDRRTGFTQVNGLVVELETFHISSEGDVKNNALKLYASKYPTDVAVEIIEAVKPKF